MELKSRIIFLEEVKKGNYSKMGEKPSQLGRIINLAVESEESFLLSLS